MITLVRLRGYASGEPRRQVGGNRRLSRRGDVSDDFDADAIGVSGERLDVGSIAGEDRAAWLGNRDDECIDG